MPDDSSTPQPTPTNYERTTGGHLRWQPPTPEHLQEMLPAYEILAILGQGGMGAVYKGRQKSLDRIVAIKILPPEAAENDMQFVERFKNEARTMAKMNHPSIVHVYDFGETSEGQLYIVMEFIDGTDVAQMIQSQGKLSEDYALSITAHVCDALQYAHTHGVVHRDIKPANVLINREGQVKVADFGLAKVTDPGQLSLTKTNMAMGTPDFVSPEALMPGIPLDGRADLYAVGVMLYNMLTGTIPRGAFRMPSITLNTDARFDKIIGKAMEMDRELRYQTALDLRRDLDVILTTPAAKTGVQSVPAAQVAAQPSLPQKPMGRGPGSPQQQPARSTPAADKSVRAPVQPPKKSSAGMIYGIAAAVVVVAVAAFMLMGGGKPPSQAKPVAESKPEPVKPAPKPVTPSPSTSATAPVPDAGWQPLFTVTEWRQSEPGKREWVDGQQHLLKMSKTKPWPAADGAIRARIHFKEGSKNISLTARGMNRDELYKLNVGNGSTLTLGSVGPGGRTLDTLGKHTMSKTLQPGDSLLLELRVQGDRLTALVNGVAVIDARDTRYSAPGNWGILADDGWFESVEMQTSAALNSSTTLPTTQPSSVLTFGGHRYQHVRHSKIAWAEAKAQAERLGGHLATITSKEEHDFIAAKIYDELPPGYHLIFGLLREADVKDWRWVTGESFAFGAWTKGQPDAQTKFAAVGTYWRTGPGAASLVVGWDDMPGIDTTTSGYLVEWDDDGKGSSASPKPSSATLAAAPAPSPAPAMPVVAPKLETPVPAADPRLTQLETGYQARYDSDAQKPYLAAVAALNQSYVANGIGKARSAAQAKGGLDEVTALDVEKTLIEKGGSVPAEDAAGTPESLKTLRGTYRAALGKLIAERDAKAAPLRDLYLKALDAYVAELTKAGKIDEAKKVQVLRDEKAAEKFALNIARTPDSGSGAPLFDGQSLQGWTMAGDGRAFVVEDGAIKATGLPGNLVFTGAGKLSPPWKNFDLTLKAKTGEWGQFWRLGSLPR
ncbi:MAG: protein kinase [Verrucomicrobiaceae bacterium]